MFGKAWWPQRFNCGHARTELGAALPGIGAMFFTRFTNAFI